MPVYCMQSFTKLHHIELIDLTLGLALGKCQNNGFDWVIGTPILNQNKIVFSNFFYSVVYVESFHHICNVLF